MDELICENEKQLKIIKYSKEYLDSRNAEVNLVKQDRYYNIINNNNIK